MKVETLKNNLSESNVAFIMIVNDPTAPVDFLTPAATPPSGNIAENTPVSAT